MPRHVTTVPTSWAVAGIVAGLASGCTEITWEIPEDAQPSTGCGGPAPTHILAHESIEVAGSSRDYTLRLPGTYPGDFPFPLVFMFHGAGSNGTQFRELVALEEAARARAIFVYPNALADTDGLTRWTGADDGPDFALRDALEHELAGAYCIDEARIFAVGFSSGAAFTNELACAGVVDGMAAIAGGGPENPPCAGPVPALVAHGRADPVVGLEYGEATREHWREANGCADASAPVDPAPCAAYEGCDVALTWCEHDDPVQIAHGWPDWTDDAIWSVLGGI